MPQTNFSVETNLTWTAQKSPVLPKLLLRAKLPLGIFDTNVLDPVEVLVERFEGLPILS